MSMMGEVVAVERYGSTSREHHVINTAGDCLGKVKDRQQWAGLGQALRSVFLPHGYPDSVSEDYLEYQVWDTVQAFCSSITGTLATQAVLTGVGVGSESATVLAATFTWLLKDGTGMVGRILFAWLQGVSLDCDCKRWRLFADILNDLAIFLEILAPGFDEFFTAILCVAGVCKSIVGVAGGATRAALTQHQARRNNMADVSAKDGSQETLVNLAGLVCSLILVPIVTGRQMLIWALFLLFTLGHLYANYSAVRAVRIETFNQTRLHLVAQHYLTNRNKTVLSVLEANRLEPVVWKQQRRLNVKLGASLTAAQITVQHLKRLREIFSSCDYLIILDLNKYIAHVILQESCDTRVELQACFQCDVIEAALNSIHQENKWLYSEMQNIVDCARSGNSVQLVHESLLYSRKHFPEFLSGVTSRGWTVSRAQLGADEWRTRWQLQKVL